MIPIKIAVLSDLHVGRAARSYDLCPDEERNDSKAIENDFVNNFVTFINQSRITADLLILPGDVTNAGSQSQSDIASTAINKIARTLGAEPAHTSFVPGNHDVDWAVLRLGKDSVRFGQRYDPLKCGDLFRDVLDLADGDLLSEPYIGVWDNETATVVGFNSSWHDNQEEQNHHGRIELHQLDQLRRQLEAMKHDQDKLRIFLIHHHPISYSNPTPGEPDFSQLVNSEDLLKLLSLHKFDLIIHGHTHQPRFKWHNIDGTGFIGILASGAFSLSLPRVWEGAVSNQFHLISVDSRDAATGHVAGQVLSWGYFCKHGWIQSRLERDGIHHREAFGHFSDPVQLRKTLRDLLRDGLDGKSWIAVESLFDAAPEFRYARIDRVMEALDELLPEFACTRHGEDLERSVILRNEACDV